MKILAFIFRTLKGFEQHCCSSFWEMITKLIRDHTGERAFLAHFFTKKLDWSPDWSSTHLVNSKNGYHQRLDFFIARNLICNSAHLGSIVYTYRITAQLLLHSSRMINLDRGINFKSSEKHPLFRDESRVSTNYSKDPIPTTTSSSTSVQLPTQTTSLSAVRHRCSNWMQLRS